MSASHYTASRGGGRLTLPCGAALDLTAPHGALRFAESPAGGCLTLRGRFEAGSSRPVALTLRPAFAPTRVHVPHLSPHAGQVMGDFVFRSPALILADDTRVIVLIPDVDDVARLGAQPDVRAFLDYDHAQRRVTVGFGRVVPEGHTFFRLLTRPPGARVEKGRTRDVSLRVHVLTSSAPADLENPYGLAARELWRRWGRRGLSEELAATPLDRYLAWTTQWAFSPQGWGEEVWQTPVLPRAPAANIDEAAPRTGDSSAPIEPAAPVFIVDVGRHPSVPNEARTWREPRAIWNQAWFSTQRCANGLYRHARRIGDDDLARRARAMTELALAAPDRDGLFPSVLRADDAGTWRWTNSDRRPATVSEEAVHLVDVAVTARGLLEWFDLTGDARALQRALAAARRLASLQRPSGAFPGWVEPNGRVAPELDESPESAVTASLLFELARHAEGDAALRAPAERARRFLERVADEARWEDFETYWSCAPWGHDTQLGRKVPRNGVFKQNTLSIFWCAEAFLRAGDLARARRCVDELSLYQAVWDPPFLATRARGGFGVMNGDCEWNDARQSLFAPLYFDLHANTGDPELFERGAAAVGAAFSMMYCPENARLRAGYEAAFPFFGPESYGFMMENQGHGGRLSIGTFTIYTWGNGSALAAVAELYDRYPEAMARLFGAPREVTGEAER